MSQDPDLLLVDDDKTWCQTAANALQRRGFNVHCAYNLAQAHEILEQNNPSYALIDLRLGHESGLTLVKTAAQEHPNLHIVVLTGYASIATAVEAIKLGAMQYLAKPVGIQDILNALQAPKQGNPNIPVKDKPASVKHLEWEHIQRVLKAHNGNISATARALNMHRRTLQRKLQKHSPKIK